MENGALDHGQEALERPEASALQMSARKVRRKDGEMKIIKKKTMIRPSGGRIADACQYVVENQLELSALILLVVFALHAVADKSSHLTPPPTATFVSLPNPIPPVVVQFRSFTTKCVHLSYREPQSGTYSKGPDDAYFVGFWVVLFTFLRAATMRYVLVPIARLSGMKKAGIIVRFAEQSWAMLYCLTFWCLGMHILKTSAIWPFSTTKLFWIGYPHTALPARTKFYYTVQFAFWIQQLFVLNIEKPRKDHAQMFLHHVITIALLASSYIFNFTRVGTAVLCIMDVVDILLPFAKLLKYLGWQTACNVAFGVFMLAWLVTRHILFALIIRSIYIEAHLYVDYNWAPAEGQFWSKHTQWFFLFLLISLQGILYVWFAMIVRVAWKVARGSGAEDTRSSSEEDEENVVESEHDAHAGVVTAAQDGYTDRSSERLKDR